MTDQQLFKECRDMIWFSVYANNNPRSCYHWQADYTYDEAQRRGKPKIYGDAYRVTYMGCGYSDPHPKDGPIQEEWPEVVATK
jgi:hypothetical protein